MKLLSFNMLLLLLFSLGNSKAQTVVSEKVFSSNSNTTLTINGTASDITFEKSPDSKVHIIWLITSNNKKEEQKLSNREFSVITYQNKENNISINAKYFFNMIMYPSTNKHNFTKLALKPNTTKDTIYATKKDVLEEILYKQSLFDEIAISDSKKNNKTYYIKQELIIKIPEDLSTSIKGTRVSLNIKTPENIPLFIDLEDSTIKTTSLTNPNNHIHLKNGGYFTAEYINKSDITLENVNTILIGTIENSSLSTNFSIIRIGEIGVNNILKDKNSKIYLYNFSKPFQDFSFTGDYSNIYFFNDKDISYNLQIFGLKNTVNHHGTSINVLGNGMDNMIFNKSVTTPEGNANFTLSNCTFNYIEQHK